MTTIYAHQDKEDDALLGLKSTALYLGEHTRAWLAVFYGVTLIMLLVAGALAGLHFVYIIGLMAGAYHLSWQVLTLDISDGSNCLIRFRSNRDFGAIVFASIVFAHLTNWFMG